MKIALMGNPNSGKSTFFNLLTGQNAKVGNWSGVTLDKKMGFIKNTHHELVDLPGIYSLTPYSLEENVSIDFILKDKPDLIINIVDVTALERSLYLTTQLLELDCKVVVVLNMMEELENEGKIINTQKLENMLGVNVFEVSAITGKGVTNLINSINNMQERLKSSLNSINLIKNHDFLHIYNSNIENYISSIQMNLQNNNSRFLAIHLLEKDEKFKRYSNNKIEQIVKLVNPEIYDVIAKERYDFIEKVKQAVIITKIKKQSITDKIDEIVLNKFIAFPLFIFIMFVIYYFSLNVFGTIGSEYIEQFIFFISEKISAFLINIKSAEWIQSLIIDGIINGVGAVFVFLPQLTALFTGIVILETTGYMARVSMMLDKIFNKIGLNGKSLISFIVGTGCSVPGMMCSRIIENNCERECTIKLTPMIPCSAKLPVIVLFCSNFFGQYSSIIAVSLYFLAIGIIVLFSMFLKKNCSFSKAYLFELPKYRLPNAKYCFREVLDKLAGFIKKAGTVILACSIFMWYLLSFSVDFKYGISIEESILAKIGKSISWLFIPVLGTNSWEATVCAIQGLVAKEQVISSMNIISGLSSEVGVGVFEMSSFSFFTDASALAFVIFNLFSAPCVSAIGTMGKELGSKRKTAKYIAFQICFAWLFSSLVNIVVSKFI